MELTDNYSQYESKIKVSILDATAKLWFLVVAIGQCIFMLYIAGLYMISMLSENVEAMNNVLPHGFSNENLIGNSFLSSHLLFAAYISFSGIIQLIPNLRKAFPKLHRWNGRIYIFSALVMSISGLYLIFSDRLIVGDLPQHIAIFINAILILICGYFALSHAVKRNITLHRRWALRLFFAVSGVWFFRVGLMFWLVLHGEPVGFEPELFTGPFLTFLAFFVYVFPVILLEIYFQVKAKGQQVAQLVTASGILIICIGMSIGIFGATMGMWLPRI